MSPLGLPWRRFETFLGGLPSDSALMSQIAEDREEADAWRHELGRATGRDYSRPRQRMTIDEFARSRA